MNHLQRIALSIAIVGCVGLSLAGCQTVEHNTPSHKAEATFTVPAATVKPLIINEFLNRGFHIVQDTPYLLVMDMPSNNAMANVLLGSQWNPIVNARASFMIAELGPQTRVVVDLALVTNPGTAMERLNPMNGSKDSEEIQGWLTALAAQTSSPTKG